MIKPSLSFSFHILFCPKQERGIKVILKDAGKHVDNENPEVRCYYYRRNLSTEVK